MTTSRHSGGRVDHPSDEDLLARLTVYPEHRAESEVDRHLHRCADCAGRYARLAALLDEVAGAGRDAFDAAMPAARLAAHRTRIVRGLERLTRRGAAPQVFGFPDGRRRPAAAIAGPRRRPAHRRLTAAAVGLAAAFGAAALLPLDRKPAPSAPHEVMATVGSSGSDEAFLNGVDLALRSPQVLELIPLDTVTPRVRTAAVDLW